MKVALLIAGEIRTNKLPFIKFIKKNNIDCFISTWRNIGKRHTEVKNNESIKIKIMNNKTGLNSRKVIDNIPNVKSKNIEDIVPYDRIDNIDDSFFKYLDNKFSPIGTVYNIYHINRALKLLQKYELEKGFKYDLIIKVRPDLYFRDFLKNKNFDFLSLDQILFSSNTSNDFQKSDKLFLANRDLFFQFIEYLNNYKNYVFSQNIDSLKNNYSQKIGGKVKFTAPIGERFFHQVVMKYNLKFRIIDDKDTFIVRGQSPLNFVRKIYYRIK